MRNDNRLPRFYLLHWSPAVPPNAQKLPHRYGISANSLRFVFIHFTLPAYLLPPHLNRDDEKDSHGGGTGSGAEWIGQDRTERGGREQLRRAAAVFCPLLATVGDEVLPQSIFKDVLLKPTNVPLYFYCSGNYIFAE